MKLKLIMIMAISAVMLSGCSSGKEAVDLILKNAVIYTIDEEFSVVDCMVIKEGKIIDIGSQVELLNKYIADEVLDAEGGYVYPGFYDPHCHFYHYGAGLSTRADLTDTKSFDDVLQIMKAFADVRSEGWLVGRGWDNNNWEDASFPNSRELNELFPDRPVMLIRVDGHAVLANDVALKLAGIDKKSRITGGEVHVANGKLTGILIDKAADILKELAADEIAKIDGSEEELINGILQAQNNCFSVGLTTVADAGLDLKHVRLLKRLQEDDMLKMNVYAMLNYTQENIGNYLVKGPYRTDRMHIRSVKFYVDGALGSRGALLLQPYSDRPDSYGLLTVEPDRFIYQCTEIYDYGFQVCTHAIGDSANRFVLNVYKNILNGENDRRWRIEHAQVVHPDDLKLFTDYSIIPSINAIHATSDMSWAQDRLGPDRIRHAYANKKLLETNGWLCNGSDFPVEPINPLLGFFAAVARQDLEGYPEWGWQIENALTREDALMAMTIWAAKACFEEKQKGSLETGKRADFVILNQDIMTIPIKKVPETKVTQTWINGNRVF